MGWGDIIIIGTALAAIGFVFALRMERAAAEIADQLSSNGADGDWPFVPSEFESRFHEGANRHE